MIDHDNDSESESQIETHLILPVSSISRPIHAERPISPFPAKPGYAIRLNWDDIRVETKEKRVLLHDLSGSVHGRLMAIMGPTGAGKTTLMNSLACRANGVNLTAGTKEIDGLPYNRHILKGIAGYVMQDDIVFENLTVEETLHYTAELRLPRSMSREEKRQRVEETLVLMQLTECRHLKVGNPRKQGISGSERKRLCVSIELLMRPRLLFLDEPTTGLDSSAAYSLMSILLDLAHSGACTILSTIHQPQPKIVELFDDLIVLCEGELVYGGPANQVSAHYARAGFPCPPGVNPADHLMEVITPMSSEQRPLIRENANKLRDIQKTYADFAIPIPPPPSNPNLQQVSPPGNDEDDDDSTTTTTTTTTSSSTTNPSTDNVQSSITSPSSSPLLVSGSAPSEVILANQNNNNNNSTNKRTPTKSKSFFNRYTLTYDKGYRRVNWFVQFWTLLKRALLLQIRDYHSLVVQFVQVIISAILIGTAYLDIGVTQTSYNKRIASLFFIVINQGSITSMIAINSFPAERAKVLRERAAGTYKVSAYFLGKVISDLIVQIGYPIIFSCIVYWLIGYQDSFEKFILFVIIVCQLQICGFAMANLVAAIGRTTSLSLVILPLVLEILRLFGGFFLPPSQIPGYFVWLDAIDFLKYGYVGLAVNELSGLQFVCDPSIATKCQYTTGEQMMVFYGYEDFSVGQCIGILFAFIIGFRILNYIVIRFYK